jgi:GH15 family glucan-1,4-alpha-glucosidase
MAARIEDYGLIGDMKGAALVSKRGDIDWVCVPRFDSEACIAALLGRDEHGRWGIRPTTRIRTSEQRYRGDTLILETEFECDGGKVRVVDFMPLAAECSHIVRIVEGVAGEVSLEMILDARFGYGGCLPLVVRQESAVTMVAGPDALHLRSSLEVTTSTSRVSALFPVKQGDRVTFVLSWTQSDRHPPDAIDPLAALVRTEAFWHEWSGRCTYQGRWRDAVLRSLITLKALTYAPTGGIVAAPTTSLPEEIGGVRNWDYRYCWLRDATLTLHSLMVGGYADEAKAFRDWLARTVAGDPSRLQIMYGLAGERRLTEIEIDWLPGYEESRPVRIGNAAWDQFQLDVYGETMSCFYTARKMGLGQVTEAWEMLRALIENLERLWQRPDEGIWEVRGGGLRHFTHSKVESMGCGRSHDPPDRGVWDGRPGSQAQSPALAYAPRADSRGRLRSRMERGCRRLHPIVRFRSAGRQRADDPARRLPAGRRSPHGVDGTRNRKKSLTPRLRPEILHGTRTRRPPR